MANVSKVALRALVSKVDTDIANVMAIIDDKDSQLQSARLVVDSIRSEIDNLDIKLVALRKDKEDIKNDIDKL